uniref:Uncharacterized protein n=1 Tax=Anguilla anguilla TaxID=7936 RepID=A0A0E9WFR9_ANGAN
MLIYTQTRTHPYTSIHICIYTYTYTYKYTHMYTHTYIDIKDIKVLIYSNKCFGLGLSGTVR